jgi:hypothetical protein
METSRTENIINLTAKTISVVFHPLFMPVFGIIIIFSAPTLFGYLPGSIKKLIILILLINNVLLPLSLLPYLRYRNYITSWSIDDRKERMLPLFIASILYAVTSYIIIRYPLPVFIKTFILGVFLITLLLTALNMWWKISIHSTAAGSIAALVLVLSFKMNSPLLWPLLLVIISAGLVLSSRLKLNSHSPSEVWSGFFLGYFGLGLLMWFF